VQVHPGASTCVQEPVVPDGAGHQEEFLLEADPANRDARTALIRYITLRTLIQRALVRCRATVNISGVCEHL